MALYFKDRIPDPIHGENSRYYDAVGDNGTAKLQDFKLVLKNNVPADRTGIPLSAGNLNFASGNAVLPAAVPEETRRGNVLYLANDGKASVCKMKRGTVPAALYASSALQHGFLKLSDNKLLMLHTDGMAVVTADFNNKNVYAGQYMPLSSTYVNLNKATLLHGFDGSQTALMCAVYGTSSFWPVAYKITENSGASIINGPSFPSAHTMLSNIVRTGRNSALMCSKAGTVFYATLFAVDEDANAMRQTEQVSLAGFGGNFESTLFSCDGGNGKCILIYYQSPGVYALPVTVSGNAITLGTAQQLGTTSDTLFESAPTNGGSGRFCAENGKILLTGNGKIQLISVDPQGTVSKSAVCELPSTSMSSGASCITYKNGRIYFTLAERESAGNAYSACLYEMIINGADFQLDKYKPFMMKVANYAYELKSAAYENPDNPGEFLFIQEYNGTPKINLTFWFGYKYDCQEPDNIIGVALDGAENGNVRVQTAGKHLAGIFSGLEPGRFYAAGERGGLAKVSGAANTNPIGMATSPTDLMFFGARGL